MVGVVGERDVRACFYGSSGLFDQARTEFGTVELVSGASVKAPGL